MNSFQILAWEWYQTAMVVALIALIAFYMWNRNRPA